MARDPAQFPNYNASNFTSAIPATSQALLDYGLISVHLKIPIDYTVTNNQTLATVPNALRFEITSAWWEVTASFTGGSSSAIGLSSDDADYNTAGDILGGVAGDVAATLVSTGRVHKQGTVGTKFGSNGKVVLAAAKVIRFNRITSIFTAGTGFVHISGNLID